jgi:hypothetical protein
MTERSFTANLKFLTGLTPPDKKGPLRDLYWTGVAQVVSLLLAYFFDVYLLEGEWGLLQDFPIYWILQIIFILEVWHIAAFDIVKRDDVTRANCAGFFATILLLGGLLPLTIQEVHQCSSIDDATQDALRQCYQSVTSAYNADLAAGCQADTDISTRATGICPQVRFGDGNGIGWIVFQFFLVSALLVTNILVLFFFLPKTVIQEMGPKVNRQMAKPTSTVQQTPKTQKPVESRVMMPISSRAKNTFLRLGPKK